MFETLPHRVRIDGDLALSVDKLSPVGAHDRTGSIDGVRCRPETDAKSETGLMTSLGSFQVGVIGPGLRTPSVVGSRRKHLLDIEASVFLQQADPPTRALVLAAEAGWDD